MDVVPEHLRRFGSKAGREALAARLGLSVDPFSQDWEYEVASVEHLPAWLAVYREAILSDDERFLLMEMLIQCVEDLCGSTSSPEQVEQTPDWQAIAALLRARPNLHANTIAYWSVFEGESPDERFAVSMSMRQVWADIQGAIAAPSGPGSGGK